MPEIFISSCTRRQLARRRPARAAVRLQLQLWLLALAAATLVVLAVRGVI
ncbi:MAG TPA: hypothetical protein VG410_08905 [Solirubrobacteraceae bacterium]|jgi:hypothetical protein|nr:hypothetical protein [Solirubrobacteraceae bacterium]